MAARSPSASRVRPTMRSKRPSRIGWPGNSVASTYPLRRLAKLVRSRRIGGVQVHAHVRFGRVQDLLVNLIQQLSHDLADARFHRGVDATVFGLDAATTGLQRGIFEDAPGFFMALAQGFDLFEILRVDVQPHIADTQGQQLEGFTHHAFDLTGVQHQLTLDHLAGDVLDQPDHGFFDLRILLGDGLEQAAHQAFEAGQLDAQGGLGFLTHLERGAAKTIFFAGGEAFVVGLLANAFQLFQGQRLDFFQRHFFHFRRQLYHRLRFRLRHMRIETGQRPDVEPADIPRANQIAGRLIFVRHGSALDHFFAALPAENDFSGFGHTAGNREDFLLGGFHVADAYRAFGFQVVAQQFGGALGHVLEDLFLDAFVRTLEGQYQHVGGDFAQQRLDATVVDIGEVVEHEHEVFDLAGQGVVDLADRVHQLAFDRAVEEVHDVGCALDTAQGGTRSIRVARELLLENRVEFFQGRRLHGVQRRHAQDDVQAHFMVEVAEHFAGLVGVEVRHHDRLDLRVLVADHVGDGARLHPFQAVEAAGVAAQQDAVDQAVGFVFAEGRGEHLADVAVGADAQAGLVADDLDELAHHLLDLLSVNVAHLRHGHAHALDLFGPHVAQHLCGVGFTQGQQQDCGFVDLGEFGNSGSTITHLR